MFIGMSVPAHPGAIERLRVPIPEWFDPRVHADSFLRKVGKDTGKDGWEFVSVNGQFAIVARQEALATVTAAADGRSFEIRLPSGTKPTDGDKLATSYEQAYAEHSVTMTRFDPYAGTAVLTKLTPDELRCRGAVATALGVKPWDVQVSSVPEGLGGGFTLELPKTYVTSKHYDKLVEVATDVIGQLGWLVKVDPKALTARLIPGEPPMFPTAVPGPLAKLGSTDPDRTALGVTLPESGMGMGPVETLDWTAAPFGLLAGLPGAGKTVLLNAVVADQVASGAELVVVDDEAKSVDFMWCKDLVRDHGWGCDSLEQSVTALGLVYEEGRRRAEELKTRGVVNWLHLPDGERFRPIFVMVDELSALTVQDPVPRGIPKDNPIVLEINHRNYMRALISQYINKIVAEQRFVGVRMMLSTQVTNASTGLPPSLKNKIGHRILAGVNPSKQARDQAFNDPRGTVEVPEHVRASGDHARGVGVADLEGRASVVFKSYYASAEDYRARLLELGAAQSSSPTPTAAQIARFAPDLSEDAEEPDRAAKPQERTPSGQPLDPKYGPGPTQFDENGKPLKGAAAAAKALAAGPPCPACGKPINPSTGECGCSW